MKASFLVPILMALVTSGCDAVKDLGDRLSEAYGLHGPDTHVIAPGTLLSAGGKQMMVFGIDACPDKHEGLMRVLFGPAANEGESLCVVIAPQTTQVKVILGIDGQRVDEFWAVEREADRIRLRRPTGEFLMPAL